MNPLFEIRFGMDNMAANGEARTDLINYTSIPCIHW